MVVLPRTMDEDLRSETGLSLTHYIVLVALSEASDGHLRMSDLAQRIALSPSRMTRVISLLQERDMVTRGSSESDGRANLVTLTPTGLHELETAWPTHLTSARTIVLEHLAPDQLAAIGAVAGRILNAAERPLVTRRRHPASG